MYYVRESLFELISEPLQHRLNRCLYGACTGAMTQAWILCQNPNGYNLDTERPVEPMSQIYNPSVLPVVTVFLQWTSNGYVTSSTLYKGTPSSFEVPLTSWIPEATLEKKRKCFEQKREDLVHCLWFNLEEFTLCKCNKCAWARANWV